jgi:hypothetical protein
VLIICKMSTGKLLSAVIRDLWLESWSAPGLEIRTGTGRDLASAYVLHPLDLLVPGIQNRIGGESDGDWKVRGSRSEVRSWECCIPNRELSQRVNFVKGSIESDQVVDSIFKLSSIHAQ